MRHQQTLGKGASQIKRFLKSSSLQPIVLALTLTLLWFYYANLELLAQPDFYKYHFEAQRLFDLNFSNMRIPPFFIFFLGLFTKIFHLFSASTAVALWVGRSLNLIATLFCLFFLNRLAEKFSPVGKSFFLWTLCLSPLFLNHFSTPVTEMVFLCFFLGTVDALSRNKTSAVLLFSLLATATRFEGVLLLAIAAAHIFFHPRLKKFRIQLFILLGFLLSTIYFLLGSLFSNRFQFHFENFFGPRGISYFFMNPDHLLNIIYSNIFFFLPAPVPLYFQITALTALIILLVAGFHFLHTTNRFLAWSNLFFIISFLLAKSYLSYSDRFYPNTRRVLYLIVLILIIVFWGLQRLYIMAQEKGRLPELLISGGLLTLFFLFHYPIVKTTVYLWGGVALIPFWGILPKTFLQWRSKKLLTLFAIILCLFVFLLVNTSLKTSMDYVISSPNKGAYAIAQYLNYNPGRNEVLFLTAPATLKYYYKGTTKKFFLNSIFQTKSIKNSDDFIAELKALVKNHNNSAIAFDFYMDYPGSIKAQLKRYLMRLRKKPELFLSKPLFYKGKAVAFLLIPSFPAHEKRLVPDTL